MAPQATVGQRLADPGDIGFDHHDAGLGIVGQLFDADQAEAPGVGGALPGVGQAHALDHRLVEAVLTEQAHVALIHELE